MRRVLVCGGRNFADRAMVDRVLDAQHAAAPIELLIEGGARGADRHAKAWALSHCVSVLTYEANWELHGKAAGPIRNLLMLDEGKPSLVVAFPGGRGTANMVEQARKRGVPLLIVEEECN